MFKHNKGILGLIVTQPQEDNQNNHVILGFDHSDKMYKRSQVDDGIRRGTLASAYNALDYFVDTYEQIADERTQLRIESQDTNNILGCARHGESMAETHTPGCPIHMRIKYEDDHPCSRRHVRVVHPPNHNHMPNVTGPCFPRRSDPAQADIYAACILLFLKPWSHSVTHMLLYRYKCSHRALSRTIRSVWED
jgi:hypothetical protein